MRDINRRRLLESVAGLATVTAGCNQQDSVTSAPSSPTRRDGTSRLLRSERPTGTSSDSRSRSLSDLTVDPNGEFESLELRPGDDIEATLDSNETERHIKLAPGVYVLDAVTPPGKIIVEGAGPRRTILRQKPDSSSAHFLEFYGSSQVEVRNCTIDVNSQRQPQRNPEGERGIQMAKGAFGIVRDVEVVNAGGHSVKWWGWRGGVAHRVYSHSAARTAPKPGGRGAIQAGAGGTTTRNIIVHDCQMNLPASNVSHRGSVTEGVLISNSRFVDPGERNNWSGISLHKTTDGLLAGNTLIGASGTPYISCRKGTDEIMIRGNRFLGQPHTTVADAIRVASGAGEIQTKNNTVGSSEEGFMAPGSVQLDAKLDGKVPIEFRIRDGRIVGR